MARAQQTIASPFCVYAAPCPRAGRAVLGPARKYAHCVNRSITCLTCKATGEESIGTDQVSRKPYRDLKKNKRPRRA
jgi:hypothetical protein